jgi:hypothetical protein
MESTMDAIPIDQQLLGDGTMFGDIRIVSREVEQRDECLRVVVVADVDPEIVSTCGMGLLFTLASASFDEAGPAAATDGQYKEKDTFTVADLVRHLRLLSGGIDLNLDWVRGRAVGTTLTLGGGRLIIETAGRGKAAMGWIRSLRGQPSLRLVQPSAPQAL